jgi:hypothetical protein
MRSSSITALILAASVAAPLSAQQVPLGKQRTLAELMLSLYLLETDITTQPQHVQLPSDEVQTKKYQEQS